LFKSENGLWETVRGALVGLLTFSLIIFILGFILFYFWPAVLKPYLSPWEVRRGPTFTLHYRKGVSLQQPPDQYLKTLDGELDRITSRLNIPREDLPDRIHVYLHQDLSQLKAAITNRSSTDSPLALLDLLEEGSFVKPLVRLVTAFGWGKPAAGFLLEGLQELLAGAQSSSQLAQVKAAALGRKLFSPKELLALEEAEKLPLSPIDELYDKFSSPQASASPGLADLSLLVRGSAGRTSLEEEILLSCRTLVSFLLVGRKGRFSQLWKASSLEEGLENFYGTGLERIDQSWRSHLREIGDKDPRFSFFRGLEFLSRGKYDQAEIELKKEVGQELEGKRGVVLAWLQFYRGDLGKAGEILNGLSGDFEAGLRDSVAPLSQLLEIYEGGERREKDGLVLTAPAGREDLPLSDLMDGGRRVIEKLTPLLTHSLRPSPDRFVLFLGEEDPPSLPNREWVRPRWTGFFSSPSELRSLLARAGVDSLSRTLSYSALLKEGLKSYLKWTGDPFQRGREIAREGSWISLRDLTISEGKGKAQARAFVAYLLETGGAERFLKLWRSTSPLQGEKSLIDAVAGIYGVPFAELEERLLDYLKA